MVRSDLKGHGIGTMMMRHLIDYAQETRIGELYGEILPAIEGA